LRASRTASLALLGLLLAAGACRKTDESAAPTAGATTPAAAAYQARISTLMFSQKLGEVAEVRERSTYYQEQFRSGQMSEEQAAREFLAWLDAYVAKNPRPEAAPAEAAEAAEAAAPDAQEAALAEGADAALAEAGEPTP
jgi:hypothetical protein